MSDLNSEQLQSIQSILIDPLRETIRTEIRLNHDQMADVISRLEHVIEEQSASASARLSALENEVAGFRAFRRKLVTIYSTLTVVLSIIWSLIREKVLSKLM